MSRPGAAYAAALIVVLDADALLEDLAEEEERGEGALGHRVMDVSVVGEADDRGTRVAQRGEGEGALVHEGAHQGAPSAALLRAEARVDDDAVGGEGLAVVAERAEAAIFEAVRGQEVGGDRAVT